jgi:hypothetical protein
MGLLVQLVQPPAASVTETSVDSGRASCAISCTLAALYSQSLRCRCSLSFPSKSSRRVRPSPLVLLSFNCCASCTPEK